MKTHHNKKYMIIAVSVQNCWYSARNNGGAARQEGNPQSATTYISERNAEKILDIINVDKMKINFRKAIIADYDEILRLKKQVHEFHYNNRPDFYKISDLPLNQKGYEEMLKDSEYEFYIVESEERICGYAIIKIIKFKNNPLIDDHNRCFIDDICVDQALRRKGIGQMLLENLEMECKSKGIKYMDLNVWNFNKQAIDFYRKFGMKEIMYRMEKRID